VQTTFPKYRQSCIVFPTFVSCFVSKVNIGALLLISDCPLKEGGIKTKQSAKAVFRKFTDVHIELGIEAMADIAERGEAIRHYQW